MNGRCVMSVGSIPGFVSHVDSRADRVMVAAWLALDGLYEVAVDLAASAVPAAERATVEERMAQLTALLEHVVEVESDPEHFAWTHDRLERPAVTWTVWGEQRRDELVDEARSLALELTRSRA